MARPLSAFMQVMYGVHKEFQSAFCLTCMSGPTKHSPVNRIMKFPITIFAALCLVAHASALSEMELGTCMCGLVATCRDACASTEQICLAKCTAGPTQQQCITQCVALVQPCMTKQVWKHGPHFLMPYRTFVQEETKYGSFL